MTTYKDYSEKMFDVSKYQDDNETDYFPSFDKLIERGFTRVGVRVSVGVVIDEDFKRYWQQAKGKLKRVPYPYLDFYSHKWLKITPEEWGKRQARFLWSVLKDDPGEDVPYLDVENSSFASITQANKSEVGRIINAFFLEYDKLSGVKMGIYTNQGYLFVFGTSHKTRPLWFSWYNRKVTIERIRQVLKDWNYTGELTYLQYTSDGDVDDDGISDARALGMESKGLDLNVVIRQEPAPQLEDEPEPPKPLLKRIFGWKGKTIPR